jgi:hypothetical protein
MPDNSIPFSIQLLNNCCGSGVKLYKTFLKRCEEQNIILPKHKLEIINIGNVKDKKLHLSLNISLEELTGSGAMLVVNGTVISKIGTGNKIVLERGIMIGKKQLKIR